MNTFLFGSLKFLGTHWEVSLVIFLILGLVAAGAYLWLKGTTTIGTVVIKVIYNFIKQYWQIIALILFILSVFLYWRQQVDTIESQQTQITQLITDKATMSNQLLNAGKQCTEQKQQLVDQINQQNTKIRNLEAQNSKNQTTINQANDDVSKIKQYYDVQIRKILEGNRPGDCQAAIKYLVGAAVDFSTQKANGAKTK
jgi:hypothetical protein